MALDLWGSTRQDQCRASCLEEAHPSYWRSPPLGLEDQGLRGRGKNYWQISRFYSGMQRVSTRKKIALQNKLYSEKIDIACIQETHLNEDIRFTIRGYQPFRCDRPTHKGGVLTLVKNDILAEEITYNTEDNESEVMAVKIQTEEKIWTIFNVYCPQNKALSLTRLKIPAENCIVVGDFNSRSERWGYPNTDLRGAEIEDWEIDNNLILCLLANCRE